MGKQIRRLTALQLCNFCGFNEFRHSKDRKKKSRYLLMGILWIFVILILLLYMAGIDITCVVLGMPKLIPLMSATIVCLVPKGACNARPPLSVRPAPRDTNPSTANAKKSNVKKERSYATISAFPAPETANNVKTATAVCVVKRDSILTRTKTLAF